MRRYVILTNFIWRFAERCGSQGIQFLVSVFLARMIEPKDFGSLALILVFTNFLSAFVHGGFVNALIQKQDADDVDYSTVFFFNLFAGSLVYVMLFSLAPLVARLYDDLKLVQLIRVVSINLLFMAVNIVQNAYITKHLQFKIFFIVTTISHLFSGVLAVITAYYGYGIWALVVQNLVGNLVATIVLWSLVEWRPRFIFSLSRLSRMFSYGWKLLASNILNSIYGNICQLIIGKVYCVEDLAYYNRGNNLPDVLINNINSSIDSVLFPTLANEQDHIERVKSMTRRAIKVSSFVIWPMVMGLAATSNQVVSLLFTDKWLSCVPYMMCFCFSYGFWPVHTANLNAIKALGRSDLFLKLEIIKKTYGIIAILIGVSISPLAMAIAFAITAPIGGIVNAYPNRKLLGYTFREQVSDMVPTMFLAMVMGGMVYCLQFLGFGTVLTLVLQIVAGVVIYTFGAWIFKFESLEYLWGMVRRRRE